MRRLRWVVLPALGLWALAACAGKTPGDSSGDKTVAAKDDLTGTAWRLEDVAGAGIVDGSEATLEFLAEGKVAGRGSCNRFFGTAKASGESIGFTGLGSTKMACAEALMDQEAKYLAALEGAKRFTRSGPTLLIYAEGLEQPLRFVQADR